jgi:hypothetical protein
VAAQDSETCFFFLGKTALFVPRAGSTASPLYSEISLPNKVMGEDILLSPFSRKRKWERKLLLLRERLGRARRKIFFAR